MSRTANPTSPAKRKLLDAAERLMLEKGFTATTVDEICAAAGLTKGSFFHYFENKDGLGKAVLKHTMERRRQIAEAAPYCKLADPIDRVYGCLDFVAQTSRKMFESPELAAGCLIGNLAQELSNTHPDIRAQCAECLAEVARDLEVDLAAAKEKHAPKSPIDPHGLAEHFVAVMEGAFILGKTQKNPGAVAESSKHFKRYLQFLFSK